MSMNVGPHMPYSPGNHPIEVVEGEPDEVRTRGQQITDLGSDMANSWSLIQRLVDDGASMEGQSIDKLRELAEKVGSDLGEAAELYSAVGPHIRTYGEALDAAQSAMRPLVAELDRLWTEYYQRSQQAAAASSAIPREPGDDAEPSEVSAFERAEGDARDAANAASDSLDQWNATAAQYDEQWDTWHTAFMTASRNIEEDTSDAIKDSTMDDLRGLLEFVGNVLAVAGIILAVLAIVIGGPIIGALAAIVAVLSLVVAIAKFGVGDGDGLELTFAIIGVIPLVGPAAKFIKGFGPGSWAQVGSSFGDDFGRLFGSGRSASTVMRDLAGFRTSSFTDAFADISSKLFSGKGLDDWAQVPATGRGAFDTVSSVWTQQLGITGMIRDTATGSFQGAFNPQQNPFDFSDYSSDAIMAPGPAGASSAPVA